jgi:hypothetical protein
MSDIVTLKNTTDMAIGVGGATSPKWLEVLHTASEVSATMAAIGGAVLVAFRVALAYREWVRGRAAPVDDDNSTR